MPQPPDWFVSALGHFDPLLSVRWGDYMKRWVLERKAAIPQDEFRFLIKRKSRLAGDPKQVQLWRQVAEELESAKAGRRVIVIVPALNRDVINALMWSDIRRYGGYSRMADEWEKREAFVLADQERQRENEMEAVHKEAYGMISFLERRRQGKLAQGERRLEKLL